MKILIINGPNLNMLGQREPEVYGRKSFEVYFSELQIAFPQMELAYFQSNHEGELIDCIHQKGPESDGIIINGGGLSHTSVSLADAISSISTPAVEVHISNIFSREAFRHHSYLSNVCKGIISGLGLEGYRFAIQYLTKSA
jgi:3-dehydroquinate dehydratase-2